MSTTPSPTPTGAASTPTPSVILINRALPYNCKGQLTGWSGVRYGYSEWDEHQGAHVCRLTLEEWRKCKDDIARGMVRRAAQWEVDFDDTAAQSRIAELEAANKALEKELADAERRAGINLFEWENVVRQRDEALAQVAALKEKLRVLEFQSSCNDTDMPDAELVAALHDVLWNITDDVDNGITGTILSKVEAMKGVFPERDEALAQVAALTKERDEAKTYAIKAEDEKEQWREQSNRDSALAVCNEKLRSDLQAAISRATDAERRVEELNATVAELLDDVESATVGHANAEHKVVELTQDKASLLKALSDCYMLACRRARGVATPEKADWLHVKRFCEQTGMGPDILRASLPSELTEGEAALRPGAPADEKGGGE